jgi:hypothetical protein
VAEEALNQKVQPQTDATAAEPEQVDQSNEAGDAAADSSDTAAGPAAINPASDSAASNADDAAAEAEYQEMLDSEVAFSWHASEFVHHHKGTSWYVGLGATTVVLVLLAVLLKLWLEIALILAMAVAIVMYARKPPKTLLYELSHDGITIDGKPRKYSEFRSFSVQPDEEWHSIELIPIKRFNVSITLLFDNEDRDAIVSHLELHLPQIDREPDIIDRLARYLRF